MTKREIGDRYVGEFEGSYVVCTVRKDGNDGMAAGIGFFSDVLRFATPEAAEKWIADHPVKKYELPQATKDFIDRNKNNESKGYLYENETGGRLKLTGLALEYFNSVCAA
jgi:hypothetical protein